MKKIYSLIRANMTNGMNIFKIGNKKSKFSNILPIFVSLYLMFFIYMAVNGLFEKLEPTHMQYVLLSLFAFGISVFTLIEGIYKCGPLLFDCNDDQLLLSLPIKRRTVLFIRLFKFYVFEVLFNGLFLLPVMICYLRYNEFSNITYIITSIIMLLFLPIIPIVLSCILSFITSSISSRFKFKNIVQIFISFIFILSVFLMSYKMDSILSYLVENANSLNDLIIKIYYPAGIYAKLVSDFKLIDLLIFILIHIVIVIITIFILSKVYFKINSRLMNVTSTKKVNIKDLNIKERSINISLIRKELNIFFKTPVFIINAGFGLVLYLLMSILISFKLDTFIDILEKSNIPSLSKDIILDNSSIFILMLLLFTSFMTSITNSLISLEGKKFNILKSLPIPSKKILLCKIYSCLVITTPCILLGDIILFIKFKISIIECIILLILSILVPLVSHFIGLIVNLLYPKLDASSDAEVVKQSTSSLVSVSIGMILLIIFVGLLFKFIGDISSIYLLLINLGIFIVLDIILYLVLITKGVKLFNKLSV